MVGQVRRRYPRQEASADAGAGASGMIWSPSAGRLSNGLIRSPTLTPSGATFIGPLRRELPIHPDGVHSFCVRNFYAHGAHSHRLRAVVRAASGRLPRVRPADSAGADERLPRVPGRRIAVAGCAHVRARGISSRWAAWARAASCGSTVVRYAPPAVGVVSRAPWWQPDRATWSRKGPGRRVFTARWPPGIWR